MTATSSTYVLDCEGLSKAVLGDRDMVGEIKNAKRHDVRVVTSSMTLVEAFHDRVNMSLWRWTLSHISVVPVTESVAKRAIDILREHGLHGHKYAIDAALVAIALRQPGTPTIFTSDAEDIRRMCGKKAIIQPI